MELNQTQKDQLEWLKKDESFILDSTKGTLTKVPTLIVGVGGTGVKALVQIKHTLRTRFEEADNIRFLAIDTDQVAKGEKTGGVVKTDLEDHEFVLLGDNITEALERPDLWSDEVKAFMPRDVQYSVGIDAGAGGYRAIGRFLFFSHLAKDLIKELERQIDGVRSSKRAQGNQLSTNLNIILVTGIAGGTGSGASIDTAYLLRALAKGYASLKNGEYNISGYIVLPDVNQAYKANPYSESNGYAYLKELDYLQSLKENREVFSQRYEAYSYRGSDGPFDECYVFSNNAGNTVATGEEGFQKNLQNISESIADSLTDVIQSGENSKTFVDSLKSNVQNLTKSINLTRNDCEYDGYYSFGSAAFRLPTNQMARYLSALTFENLEKVYLNEPTPKDQEVFYGKINLTFSGMLKSLNDVFKYDEDSFPISSWEKNPNYSYEKVIQSEQTPLATQLEKAIIDPVTDASITAKKKAAHRFMGNLATELDAYSKNIEKGPWYVSRLFGHHTLNALQGNDIFTQIKEIKEQISARTNFFKEEEKRLEEALKALKSEKTGVGEVVKNLFQFKIRTKQDVAKAYVQTYISLYDEVKKPLLFCETIDFQLTEYEKSLKDAYQTHYGPIAEIMGRLRKNSKEAIKSMERPSDTEDEDNNNLAIVDLATLTKTIRNEFEDRNRYPQDFLNNKFLDHVQDNLSKFLGEGESRQNINIPDLLHRFIQVYYRDILDNSLYNILSFKAGLDGKQFDTTAKISNVHVNEDIIKAYVSKTIRQKLNQKSKPSIKLVSIDEAEAARINGNNVYERIGVSDDPVDDAIYDSLNETKQNQEFIDRISDRGKISEINFLFGFPIYMYSELQRYRLAYEDVLGKGDVLLQRGLHLYGGSEGIDWKDLSSPIPIDRLRDTEPVVREQKRFEKIEELFDKALSLGIITKGQSDDNYTLHFEEGPFLLGVGNKARQRLQKMFQNIPIVEGLVAKAEEEKEEAARKAQEKRRVSHMVDLLLTETIKDSGGFKYSVELKESDLELGNFVRYRDFNEFYVCQAFHDQLTESQMNLALSLAKERLKVLEDKFDELYLPRLSELKTRLESAQNHIIEKNPENAQELTDFYSALYKEANNR